MKAFLLFVIVTLLPAYVFSQQADSSGPKYDYDYLSDNQVVVDTRAQATYMRVYMGLDSLTGLYEARDYTLENPRLVAVFNFSDSNYLYKDGPAVWFGPGLKQRERGEYRKGEPAGEWISFYRNGQKKKLYIYEGQPALPTEGYPYRIRGSWDSTGQAEVVNGNGIFIGRDDTTGAVKEKGMIKDGLRDGLWQFFYMGEPDYEEVYTNGKFIKGIRFGVGEGGAHVTYDSIFIPPGFPGGHDALAAFLSANIRYPREAVELRQTGTAYVQFTVEPTGQISHIKTVNSTPKLLAEEAMRIIKRMPRWKPGKDRGKVVPLHVMLPIRFTL
jgi:TonB family protein